MENKSTEKPAFRQGRYLKYAVGEIALVVIGILLALQINNWNEDRKLTNEVETLMSVFEGELEDNIESCNSLIRMGYLVDSISSLYVNNEITREMILDNPRMLLGFNTNTRRFIDDHLDQIIEIENNLPKKYRALVADLKELKRLIESQRKWEQVVIDLSLSRSKEMSDQYPWYFLDDSLSKEKRIAHYLTDAFHKSKIIHYNGYQLDENIWDATLIRTNSTALLWNIKNLRGSTTQGIEVFLKDLGLRPFEEIECGDALVETNELISMRANYIFYNNRSDSVEFNVLDLEGNIRNRTRRSLAPHSFYRGEYRLGENYFIEVLVDDSCYKVYRHSKEEYLIVN